MTDHDGTENDRKTGPTFTGNDGGSEITFPLELRGYAPGVAGSYNWTTKYYGNNGSGTHSEVNVPATINVGSTSELVVDIIPETSPMFFGSGGGTINCDVYVENTTASPAAFDGWFDATLPNGFHYGPIFGPVSGTFPGNAHTTRPFSFSLPGGAPSGVYSLNVYLGDYDQSIVYDADSFTFVKE